LEQVKVKVVSFVDHLRKTAVLNEALSHFFKYLFLDHLLDMKRITNYQLNVFDSNAAC